MRTSLSQQIQTALLYMNTSNTGLSEAQERAISGKRISRPSDDVAGTNRSLSLRSAISTVEQYANNISVSKPIVSTALDAAEDMVSAIRSVRDIAISAAKPQTTESTTATYISELDSLMEQMVDLANTKHSGQYVFSGTATDTSPVAYDSATGTYSYQGDAGVKRTQVLDWVSIQTNVDGSRAFNFDGSAGAGSTDIFTMVSNLKDAIESGDANAVSSQLDNIDANLDNMLSCTAQLGSWVNRMDSASTILTQTKDRLTETLSDTEDVDTTEAVVEFMTQQNVYQAAISITGKMLGMSLVSLDILG